MKKTLISKEQHMEIIPFPIRDPPANTKTAQRVAFLRKIEWLLVMSRKKQAATLDFAFFLARKTAPVHKNKT